MSINIPQNATVTISVNKGTELHQKKVEYTPAKSLQVATPDDTTLVALTRDQYVDLFKKREASTAEATLAMCRVVYEAKQMLNSADFQTFCKKIGQRDEGSTIRKFIAIGKVQPRLIAFANQLPVAWSNIYALTQIPADDFEQIVKTGRSLRDIKGKELKALVDSTKQIEDFTKNLPRGDKKKVEFQCGVFFLTKRPDDTDWRAIKKAISEIETRLPVLFKPNSELERIWTERRDQRYEATKVAYEQMELRPELWDMGQEANAVGASTNPSNSHQHEAVAA
jgi:hypothetical protein